MRKLAIAIASVLVGIALSVSHVVPTVYAAERVDCDAVTQGLGHGKTLRQVASDMKISVGRVRGCKKRASRAAKAEEKTSPGNRERMTRSEASRAAGRGARSSPEAAPQASPAPSR